MVYKQIKMRRLKKNLFLFVIAIVIRVYLGQETSKRRRGFPVNQPRAHFFPTYCISSVSFMHSSSPKAVNINSIRADLELNPSLPFQQRTIFLLVH